MPPMDDTTPGKPPGPADPVSPGFRWHRRDDGSVEVTVTPPAGSRLCLARVGLAGVPRPLVAGVVGAPAGAAVVITLEPA